MNHARDVGDTENSIISSDAGSMETLADSPESAVSNNSEAARSMNSGRRDRLFTLLLVLVLIVGLGLLIYPSFSNWWNERFTTRVVISYDETVSSMDEEDTSAYFEEAAAYNELLAAMGSKEAFSSDALEAVYEETLDITGTGVMGYITIEKINVELPVYHGTSASVLSSGAGHLEGSSLPMGGESTHCVISAHRGLPSAQLFTRLDELEIGDTFTITVLDQVLTYEVDQISIVLPTEMEYLYIEDGEDYVTLMTCTPYGINTHRLLVRGTRVETAKYIRVTAEAYKVDTVFVAGVIAVPMFAVLLLWLLITTHNSRRKRRKRKNEALGD
ncbi:MAG: class C sortase [Lachnospiraceae bacterium]|nr:class C sortase [Lachnospiraceae bacterium]